MKKQSINNEIQTVISVADYYTDHIYLKYNIVNNNIARIVLTARLVEYLQLVTTTSVVSDMCVLITVKY